MFNVSEFHLKSRFEDAALVILKATTVGDLGVRGTHTPNHILIGIIVEAQRPVVQVTTMNASLGIGEGRVVVLQT